MKKLRISVAVALALPASVFASTASELAELKMMFEEMKQQYETRIADLEQRVQSTEVSSSDTRKRVEEVEQKTEVVASRADNSFNPAISMVLQGSLATYSKNPSEFSLAGMPLGGEAGLHKEGFSLIETELTASANVDNWFYGQATIGLHENDAGSTEVDMEEAFLESLSLPAGLGLRMGRFFSDVGYLNAHHTHTWDFADAPLAYQAFLGKQYRDDGVRMSWVAPVDDVFLELGVEALRGGAYPGGGTAGDLGAVQHAFAHVGGDLGRDSSWQVGLSQMNIDVVSRSSGAHAHGTTTTNPTFAGDSSLSAIDGVWKTDLSGGRQLIVQGEYFRRDEDGRVTFTEDSDTALFGYDGDQTGWYLQGIFQFDPQWRTGLRYDRLSASNVLTMVNNDLDGNATALPNDEVFSESGFQSSSRDPERWTAMLDWNPSEFSRVRFQYSRDESGVQPDDQLMLQYIMSLGAHGAHQY